MTPERPPAATEPELDHAQLAAVVDNLAEAVTVTTLEGWTVYANQAAVDLLRMRDVDELYGTPPLEVMDRFAVYDEDGRPIGLEDLPSARLMAGEDVDRLLVRNVVRATGEERWLLNKVTILSGPGGEPRRLINVIEDVSSVKRAERAQRVLAEAGDALVATLDYAETLQAVAAVAVPALAECAVVEMRGERVAAAGDLAALDEHVVCAPIEAGGEQLGSLLLASGRRAFDADEAALARELGRRAGVAVLNARLYTRRTSIAMAFQHGLLPPRLPDVPGWSAAVLYRPAGEFNEVGGDFYDVFEGPDGWMAVIGDVAGQGAEAATQTSLARFTARTAAELTGDVTKAIGRLNDTLRTEDGLPLCTVVCARLYGGELTLASAGHPPPLLVRDGRVSPVGEAGVIAGAFDGETWPESRVALEPGDVLVLYTDGVLDTVGEDCRFGQERLCRALAAGSGSVEERLATLHAELQAFQRGPQRDDTTVLVLEFQGNTGPEGQVPLRDSLRGRTRG